MTRLLIVILFFLIVIFSSNKVFAQSSYVLPYPSVMPGNIFYSFKLIQDAILQYFYFGDFAQFEYNLEQSDKYFVEAKTLFDYKQYLLARSALDKSNSYFKKIKPTLLRAFANKKDVSEKMTIFISAANKHIEELIKIKSSTPSTFEWTPEFDLPTSLKIHDLIDDSIEIRKKVL